MEPYLEQLEQKINRLIAEGDLEKAYVLCKDFLEKFPDLTTLVKLKAKIEDKIVIRNKKIIENKIDELNPLWKEEKYVEIIQALKEIAKLAPENKKIIKLLQKAQKAYQEKIENLKTEFNKAQRKRLDELLNTNEEELMDALFTLEKNNPGNQEVLALTNNYRDSLIANKIKTKKNLIYSDKYTDLENFLTQLKRIDNKNPRIPEIETFIKQRHHRTQIDEKQEFVYTGKQQLETLMKIKKYDKAIHVAEEILEADKEDKEVKKILKEAKRKFFKETKKLTTNEILKTQASQKEEYLKNKSQFIKI